MKKYFKKYAILLIVLFLFQGILKFLVVSQLQIVLMNMGVEFIETSSIINMVHVFIPILINSIVAIVILMDVLQNKMKGIPIVLLTIMSHFAGVIFFLFLINNKISSHDK